MGQMGVRSVSAERTCAFVTIIGDPTARYQIVRTNLRRGMSREIFSLLKTFFNHLMELTTKSNLANSDQRRVVNAKSRAFSN